MKVNTGTYAAMCVLLAIICGAAVVFSHDWHAGDVVKTCGLDARVIKLKRYEVQLYMCPYGCTWRTRYVTPDLAEAERVCGGGS